MVDIDLDLPTNVAAASGWVSTEPVEPKKTEEKSKASEPAHVAELEEARRQAQDAQSRLDALSKRADEERQGRLRAQELAERNQTYALNAHLARMDANLARVTSDHEQINTSISAWKSHLDMAKRQFTLAREAGDTRAEADLTEQIAEAKNILNSLEAGKTGSAGAIEEARRNRDQARLATQEAQKRAEEEAELAAKREREPASKQITPDEYISNVREKAGNYAADWFKEHREFITDGRLQKKMQVFVEDWVDRNGASAVRTASFKDALDERFGFKKAEPTPAPEEEEEMEDEKPQRSQAAPAAPVSRQSNGTSKPNGAPGSRIRLSEQEQATALMMYPDMAPTDAKKKYATNKARLIADGRL